MSPAEWYRLHAGERTATCIETPTLDQFENGLHEVYREGHVVGQTFMLPTVLAIMKRDRINAGVNYAATEKRWEAWSSKGPSMGFSGDPNDAVLQCAAKLRRFAKRPLPIIPQPQTRGVGMGDVFPWLAKLFGGAR